MQFQPTYGTRNELLHDIFIPLVNADNTYIMYKLSSYLLWTAAFTIIIIDQNMFKQNNTMCSER